MSYDFTLFELEPGKDVHTVLSDREQRVRGTRKLSISESKTRNRAIAQALVHFNPKFDWRPFALADIEGIEIDAGEGGNGIQIDLYHSPLYRDEASVTVPYWYDKDEARLVMTEIWHYLGTIQQMTGYVIYDPQLGRLIDLENDFETVVKIYNDGMDSFEQLTGFYSDQE